MSQDSGLILIELSWEHVSGSCYNVLMVNIRHCYTGVMKWSFCNGFELSLYRKLRSFTVTDVDSVPIMVSIAICCGML